MTVYPDEGGSPIVLGDEAKREFMKARLPSQARIVTAVPLYGADFQKVFSGGNRLNTFSWLTDRTHTNADIAQAFVLTHADSVPLIGTVEILHGAITRWLKSAVIPEVRCVEHDGMSTVFQYTVMGGQFLLTNPNQ